MNILGALKLYRAITPSKKEIWMSYLDLLVIIDPGSARTAQAVISKKARK